MPIAKLINATTTQTKWLISWPSSLTKQGKAYVATTYPFPSELISIETVAKRRPISSLVGRRILPEIRAAIARNGVSK